MLLLPLFCVRCNCTLAGVHYLEEKFISLFCSLLSSWLMCLSYIL
ncbi:hypothetical protein T03_9421 [Trichinella britovi]|uniref:Uncharacterized protein n=1 Tax=Trichinella britovi TaxID=45882 RepID=A0A0V1AJQ2_TRIBR|nr:hypothetical protein T03_9421 [Trichinella britovi]